jgi:hypothetical protein
VCLVAAARDFAAGDELADGLADGLVDGLPGLADADGLGEPLPDVVGLGEPDGDGLAAGEVLIGGRVTVVEWLVIDVVVAFWWEVAPPTAQASKPSTPSPAARANSLRRQYTSDSGGLRSRGVSGSMQIVCRA